MEEGPVFLRACGLHVRALRPEQSTNAAILAAALPPPASAGGLGALQASGALNSMEGRRGCCMGFFVGLGGLGEALAALASPALSGSRPFCLVLEEGAESLEGVLERCLAEGGSAGSGGGGAMPPHTTPTAFIIVLGDNEGLTPEQSAQLGSFLERSRIPHARAALGASELLASQCMVLVHYFLDKHLGASAVAKRAFDPRDKYADKVKPCSVCAPYHPDLAAHWQEEE